MNVIHSVDSYVLRTLVRRCMYSPRVLNASKVILERSSTPVDYQDTEANRVWKHTGMADFSMLEGLTQEEANKMNLGLKRELLRMIELSLSHKPFDIVCIHDSFATHGNNINQMRRVYADIMAALCRSTLAEDLLNQLYGNDAPVEKLSNTTQLAEKIAQSNYGVC